MIRKFLTEHVVLKLLSLGMAVALWMAVGSDPVTEATFRVPLEFLNVPAGVEVSTDQPSVQVWARGPSQAIRRATPSDFLVRLNVSPVLPQSVESTYALDPANVSAPTSLKIIRLVPADVTVSFDKIVTKAVPISPRFYGQPPTGYHLKEFHLNPSEAWIQGPSRHVERIKAVLTDPIDLSQLVSAKSLVANVNPDDPLVHVMYDQAVTATVAAEKNRAPAKTGRARRPH